eukprot:1614180-Pleurochrysis_carterae.AAC.1
MVLRLVRRVALRPKEVVGTAQLRSEVVARVPIGLALAPVAPTSVEHRKWRRAKPAARSNGHVGDIFIGLTTLIHT